MYFRRVSIYLTVIFLVFHSQIISQNNEDKTHDWGSSVHSGGFYLGVGYSPFLGNLSKNLSSKLGFLISIDYRYKKLATRLDMRFSGLRIASDFRSNINVDQDYKYSGIEGNFSIGYAHYIKDHSFKFFFTYSNIGISKKSKDDKNDFSLNSLGLLIVIGQISPGRSFPASIQFSTGIGFPVFNNEKIYASGSILHFGIVAGIGY